ncbi:hypothetical protein PGH47_26360 [Streptomyces sp. HUAS 31]|uniref:hypothetical protein n=1 Tax=Streptomyces TaxID=1883 RepID=UPI002306268F|nr:hypothetical protein [Streptomyces sp. HUAS 31]WCD98995.1 hypothetical protein PGH47_26360 [Streptomyces sp. HUAS 31]
MRRVLSVHFAPCALFVAGVLALVRAGSFQGRSDWRTVPPESPAAAFGALVLISSCSVLLGLLLQPFQVRAVRVLEGYWDRWPLTSRLASLMIEVQRKRWRALSRRADTGVRGGGARRVQADVQRRLAARPPEDVLMPTALGNALRAGEISAGERYGLATLASWPRLYLQVSERALVLLRSCRDALDTAVNLCWSCLVLTGTAALALYDEPSSWWLCGLGLAFAATAYKGAVTAAQSYAGLMHVAYDLHRFDLLEALHYSLPADRKAEEEMFLRVSDQLMGGRTDLPYDHGRTRNQGHDTGSP